MDKPAVDSFFRITSRLVIVFPILVIISAFFLWSPPQKKLQKTPAPTPEEAVPNTGTKIDINGSYVCLFTTEKHATVSALIKNKSLYVQSQDKKKTTYVLFQKDCLYEWQENSPLGQMTCGLGQYVSMFESMSKLGLATPDSYLQKFLGDTQTIKDQKGNTTTLGKACQKREIKNTKIFEVPKPVQFIKKKK